MWLLLSLAMQTTVPQTAQAAEKASSKTSVTPLWAKVPTPYEVLAAEHNRGVSDKSREVLVGALASRDTVLQRLAVRAFGRIQRGESAPALMPLLRSPAASVRRELLNALAQMNAPFDYATLLRNEKNATVRAAAFEAIGRTSALTPGAPRAGGAASAASIAVSDALVAGLRESDARVRTGAARGIESLLRRTARATRPTNETLVAIHDAFRTTTNADARQLLLLAMTAAADRDSATIELALRDTSAQVRRVAVALGRRWVDDKSALVRYQALRVAGTCERAAAHLRDASAHVALTSADILGEKTCAAALIDSIVTNSTDWRMQAHALVALAKVDRARALASISRVSQSTVWQARAWAAQAAKAIGDSTTLARLARDTAPNVAIAAMSTDGDAMRALASDHSGLVLAAATHFKGKATAPAHAGHMADALLRLSAKNIATNRDPREALLQRLLELADSSTAMRVAPLLRDVDVDIAALAARVMNERARVRSEAVTTVYTPAAFPSEATLRALRGATAQIRLKNLGTLDIVLLPDDAPATVAIFADLADRGAFNGLTWHRIVPNFVLQGGSPGADEYDAITTTFMRDELGFARHARGTFGISTRGRDTGDGQLFINLVDNFRLDHDYTVFATMVKGLEVMDRVQEGDVIESIRIVRKR